MRSATVDSKLCLGCGICVQVCPSSQLELSDGKASPAASVPRPCNGCGHCHAVCPANAIRIWEDGIEILPPAETQPAPEVTLESLAAFMKARRSVRFFSRMPVDRGLLERIMGMNCWAPTACNRQQLGWIVLTGSEVSRFSNAIAEWALQSDDFRSIGTECRNGHDTATRNAPVFILCHGPKGDFTAADCAIALEDLELLLAASGLGSCWSGLAAHMWRDRPDLVEYLGLPSDRAVYGGLMVGWPDVRFLRVPPRKSPDIIWR